MWSNLEKTADLVTSLVTFTEEILNARLHFLCNVDANLLERSCEGRCLNNGTCTFTSNGTKCNCPFGFYGERCENNGRWLVSVFLLIRPPYKTDSLYWCWMRIILCASLYNHGLFSYFLLMFNFYNPWKHQKTRCIPIQMEH